MSDHLKLCNKCAIKLELPKSVEEWTAKAEEEAAACRAAYGVDLP